MLVVADSAMHWITTRDGTRFLVQDPQECARSLRLAFPRVNTPVSSPRFMRAVKKECPPPARVEAAAPRSSA